MNTPRPPSRSPAATARVAAVVLDDDTPLDTQELARACCVGESWVVERVEAGLLETFGAGPGRQWQFTGASLVRARRMLHLEQGFDANPELAALTADLIEEVARLRARIRAAGLHD